MNLRTIFEIGKVIDGLKEDRDRLIEREKNISLFSAFIEEDKEAVRPEYDYEEYQGKIDSINKRIRNLTKEAVSYLVNTKVAECGDMTIIDALLYVDDLREKEERLYAMISHQEMERKDNPYRAEYEYVNYDRKKVEEEYIKTRAELERIKMYLDFYIYELSYDSEKQSEPL